MIELDEDGQPKNPLFNRKLLSDRSINELIGLARGIISDGVVIQEEAEFLLTWMENNSKYHDDKIINTLYGRIKSMLEDEHLDEEEQKDLLDLLKSITGENCPAAQAEATTATLPLDADPQPISFRDKKFCLTGKFAYAPRKVCESSIRNLGGVCQRSPTNKTDYLVLGTLCSRDWAHSSYGRKIEKGLEIKESGTGISIIHEDHWIKYLVESEQRTEDDLPAETTQMNIYKITGVNKNKEEETIELTTASEKSAAKEAKQLGIYPTRIVEFIDEPEEEEYDDEPEDDQTTVTLEIDCDTIIEPASQKEDTDVDLNPILISTYRGDTPDIVLKNFKTEAEELVKLGYYPTTKTWIPVRYRFSEFFMMLLLCFLLIGFFGLIYMIITGGEAGMLSVTYKLEKGKIRN